MVACQPEVPDLAVGVEEEAAVELRVAKVVEFQSLVRVEAVAAARAAVLEAEPAEEHLETKKAFL
jgi:hypothetical protein